ncbi:hypothetical protein DH2020_002584 [Rehmannia glutinosa]|uniref:Uncharacterized protein n=1 Tax=Rehmannia glutinosa TaxID=99300 RepID=A0ABR0XUH4_REHGL
MELNKILHMNVGDGETSYANNSGLQKVIMSKTWSVLDDTLKSMFTENGFLKCMKMADLGCSSGPNTLFLISHIMDTIQDLCKHNNNLNSLPQLEVLLNDLPNNDFNNLFKLLSEFCQNNGKEKLELFVYGVPGSFYDRLFPSNSLHFAYTSCSLHWLSKIPEGVGKNNKENIHVAVTSPPEVLDAYVNQFKMDFSRFLRLRAEEITFGGRMVLVSIGRSSKDPRPFSKDEYAPITILSQTLSDMVAQGLVKEEDLYSFNMPVYTPYPQEIEAIISGDGSFNLDKMEVFHVPCDAQYDDYDDMVFDKFKSGKIVADCVRAFTEPMLASHFGGSINIDGVYDIYAKKLAQHLSKERLSSSLSDTVCCGFVFDSSKSLVKVDKFIWLEEPRKDKLLAEADDGGRNVKKRAKVDKLNCGFNNTDAAIFTRLRTLYCHTIVADDLNEERESILDLAKKFSNEKMKAHG